MKPRSRTPQCELFGAQLSELLNPEHPLYVLAERIDWSAFDVAMDACYADELGRNRNYLTGQEGDKINALLAAAGYNLRKLLRWVVFAPIFWPRCRLVVWPAANPARYQAMTAPA